MSSNEKKFWLKNDMNKQIDEKVLETENFSVGQDWEVPIPGFFIIASKDRNKKSFLDFSQLELSEFINLQHKVRRVMKEVLSIEVVYFFQNEDSEHGFHVWCFPRLLWMEKFGKKIESVRPIMNYAKENLWTEENLKNVKDWCEAVRKN
jgi:diadenosine tetraphosphate (Ap4A) HIT family hydrolase